MILDFGKYKGRDVLAVPLAYKIFLSGHHLHCTQRTPTDLSAHDWIRTNRPHLVELANAHLKTRCWHCEGALVPLGSARSNGADHDDWPDRFLHKSCWKTLKRREKYV